MIRTLLVSGDKPSRDIVKVGLTQAQAFQVETAEAEWAVEIVKAKVFDCIVVDTVLGGADALEILRECRELLPDAELLLMSRGKTESRYLSRDSQELDIADVIQLPIEPLAFFRQLNAVIQRVADRTPVGAA